MESSDVVGRVSKGIGLPGGLPDIIGLAIRIPPQPFAATSWDILMAPAGSGLLTRFALRPVTSWHASMSSLMPLRYEGKYWWVRSTMTSELDANGLSLDDVADQIHRSGVEYLLDQAAGADDFQPLARVRFDDVVSAGPSNDVDFDPTIHSAPGVKLAPEWLTDIRRRAYDRSREGRHAESCDATHAIPEFHSSGGEVNPNHRHEHQHEGNHDERWRQDQQSR